MAVIFKQYTLKNTSTVLKHAWTLYKLKQIYNIRVVRFIVSPSMTSTSASAGTACDATHIHDLAVDAAIPDGAYSRADPIKRFLSRQKCKTRDRAILAPGSLCHRLQLSTVPIFCLPYGTFAWIIRSCTSRITNGPRTTMGAQQLNKD